MKSFHLGIVSILSLTSSFPIKQISNERCNQRCKEYTKCFASKSEVTLKMAFDQSPIWGVADNAEEKSERFTSGSSLDLVHRLRRECDCVLVGRGTVERDDCTLTVRRVSLKKSQPVRVVIDPQLNICDGNYALLNDGLSTIIYHCKDDVDIKIPNVSLISLSESNTSNTISSQSIIDDLASRNMNHIMVEGGPITALSFLKDKNVDRAIIIRAPVTFGDPVPSNMSEKTLIDAGLVLLGKRMSDDDVVEYWSREGLLWPDELESWP